MTSVLAVIFAVWFLLSALLVVVLARRRASPEFVGDVLVHPAVPESSFRPDGQRLAQDLTDARGLEVVTEALTAILREWDGWRAAGCPGGHAALDALDGGVFQRARVAVDAVGERMPR